MFPGSGQVSQLGLQDASDTRIFEFARTHGYAIVTFDSDFVDLCIVKGIPPRLSG